MKTLSRVAAMFVLFAAITASSVQAQIIIWYPYYLPDLQPVDLSVGPDCAILVTLRNNGPGAMPSSAYVGASTGIQMYVDGQPWGGVALGGWDTAHATQPAGGTFTAAWFPSLSLPPGIHTVTVETDTHNDVWENNESNNSITRTLSCGPDLAPVSLSVNSQCQIVVTLRNLGNAPIPDANFAMSYGGASGIQMYNDGQPFGGITLGAMDVSKQVQPAGGSVTYTWFPSLTVNGTHNITIVADNNNAIAEINESNNSLTQTLSCYQLIYIGPVLKP